MGLARCRSVALCGVSGQVIDIEVDISAGLPGLTFTGLADTAITEARDRVRAAVLNSGFGWPGKRITVALLPADVRKNGAFDLALALAVLAAAGSLPVERLSKLLLIGELGLDGSLRGARGVLPAVLVARAAGVAEIIVATANAGEAAVVPGVDVRMASTLRQVVLAMTGEGPRLPAARGASAQLAPTPNQPDLSEVVGQPVARRAVEIAAAGGHHLLMTGVPGAGKTMLAERLPGILPELTDEQALEVTAIHSVAGLLPPQSGLIRRPPLQSPHHTASKVALVGGGTGIGRPGAASLAHHGVLVLDEAAEFMPDTLDALRQPLESGRIVIHRSRGATAFPARFLLVLATNPCPCGAARDPDCRCTPDARRRYQRRLSGPLLDRVDLRIPIDPVSHGDLMADRQNPEPSSRVGARVRAARSVAVDRWRPWGWTANGQVPGTVLRSQAWRPGPDELGRLRREVESGLLSARGCDRVLRLAWTLADLTGRTVPGRAEISEAIWLRSGRTDDSNAAGRHD